MKEVQSFDGKASARVVVGTDGNETTSKSDQDNNKSS